MQITDQEMAALLRHDLSTFIIRCFTHLHPDTEYLHNWHIDLIASRLTECVFGQTRRLIINVPPRSMKSICTSVALAAWILGHQPAARIICASYGQDLADKLAQDCRSIMQSDWYKDTFPTRLVGGRPAAADLLTTEQGGRLATSVGGAVTGRGADFIIVDDPLKPDEALSEARRTNTNGWFDRTLLTRLNDKKTGRVIVIMQRLHMDDLVGHLQQQGGWQTLVLPAIAEQPECWTYKTLLGTQTARRQPGDVLHAEREPLHVLNALKAALGEYHFAGQYQQNPVPQGGGLVKEAWLRYYAPAAMPPRFDRIVQSWDTASKVSELADYSVCTTWGMQGKQMYLLDVLRQRFEFPALKRAVKSMAQQHGAQVILIEDKASGIQLIQELRAEGLTTVKAVKPEGDKVMRLQAQTPAIEGGFVLLPQQAHWLDAYRLELTTFPKGRYADQVDSTSQALQWMQGQGKEPGLLAYYRELAMKQNGTN